MIWLTEYSKLTEGLYWARELKGEGDLGHGPWVIACVVGQSPFLDAYVVAVPAKDTATNEDIWTFGRSREPHPFRANRWEFGPRINTPANNERAEYPPMAATERVLA